MERLLTAFKIFKQEMHEMENGDKMKDMSPNTTMYDLQHQFSRKTGKASKVLDRLLLKEPEVYHTALNSYAYANSTPQNQVLFHGVLFKALFNIYIWLI